MCHRPSVSQPEGLDGPRRLAPALRTQNPGGISRTPVSSKLRFVTDSLTFCKLDTAFVTYSSLNDDRPVSEDSSMFANLSRWQMLFIPAALLILLGARRLPRIARGFREALSHFRKALDEEAYGAGRSLGGIHGKPAAEALTPDNQTAELTSPPFFQMRIRSTEP